MPHDPRQREMRTYSRRQALGLMSGWLVAAGMTTTGCSTVSVQEEQPSQPVGQILPAKLAMIHTASVEGCFEQSDTCLGISAVAQLRSSYEQNGYDVLLLDGGNTLGGSQLVDLSQGESGVGILNASSYDALCLGCRELALGSKTLAKRESQADWTLLSANATDADDHEALGTGQLVRTLSDGRLVGIFAITAPAEEDTLPPLVAAHTSFQEDKLTELAQQQVAELREQDCRLVVCLTNLTKDKAVRLAKGVSGIDVVLATAGNWDAIRLEDASSEEMLLVCTPHRLEGAGVVTWELGKLSARMVAPGDLYLVDEQVEALVTQTSLDVDDQLSKVLTASDETLSFHQSDQRETILGDLVADALLWEASHGLQSSPDAALIDGTSLQASLGPHDITRADALVTCPLGTAPLCTVETSGAELHDLLERAIVGTGEEGGSFLQMTGIDCTLQDEEGKVSLTIDKVDGRDFSPTARYDIVTTQHLASGATGLPPLTTGWDDVRDLETCAGLALADYLAHECKGRLPKRYEQTQGHIRKSERHEESKGEDEPTEEDGEASRH